MEKDFLRKAGHIHLTGIGGTGMSGLAALLVSEGKKVSGSDSSDSDAMRRLGGIGIRLFYGHDEKNLDPGTDVLVHSHAISPDNPEIRRAVSLGIPCISYPEAVGSLMLVKRGIAVSGTHGKTSTSAIIVDILRQAGKGPSFLIGGEIKGLGNSMVGMGDFLVVEACEFRSSFLHYSPEIAVVNNIERDHLDYYKSLTEIKRAFGRFVSNIKPGGVAVYCSDDENTCRVVEKHGVNKISYGIKSGSWRAENILFEGDFTCFECLYKGSRAGIIRANVKGVHNIVNSLAAIAVASYLDIPFSVIKEALYSFRGVHRRCEILGRASGITVMDDYGHHPTEIKATLGCIKNMFPRSRLIVVFQPHQYSRTRFLLEDFAGSFGSADKVVVSDIYFVRDSLAEKKLVNSEILVVKMREEGVDASYIADFNAIIDYLIQEAAAGDIVLTLGAGPVDGISKKFLSRIVSMVK